MSLAFEANEGRRHGRLKVSFIEELLPLLRLRWLQLLALAGLLAVIGFKALSRKAAVLDLDVWWHLKVGEWIVAHHSLPHTGILSWTAANRPWAAYSWGYEVLLSRAYTWFGLLGMGGFGVLLTVAVAYAIYWMLRRLSGRFWAACLLAFATCWTFLFNIMPRPVYFSMMLFAATLTLILQANRSGRVHQLYWLPAVFLLWANLHIQFIYGLFALGLLVAVNLLLRLMSSMGIALSYLRAPTLPFRALAIVFGICVVATCIGPYSFHLYQVIYSYSQAKVPYAMIIELQPVNFAAYSHYAQLLLTAAAFFAVARQKKIDLFKLALLTVATIVGFRTLRDSWFVCITAAACIADFPAEETQPDLPETIFENLGVAAVVALLLMVFARTADFNPRGLDHAISNRFPVNAANFLRQNPSPGPLYNSMNWGGFLTWYLPDYPVAIDGRTDLYGDEMNLRFFNTAEAAPDYATDPYLNQAGVVLLQKTEPLAEVLPTDPRFQLVYQDDIAELLVRRPGY